MPYIPHGALDVEEMLRVCGIDSVDRLFDPIPAEFRLRRRLRLPKAAAELTLQRESAEALARTETFDRVNAFLGAGVYDHFIPAAVGHLAHRVETVTSYTPYQPEASQGNLTFMFEYQTAICELTGMEVSNASMYEGASACAEAALMALRVNGKGRTRIVVSETVHPEYRQVLDTYLRNLEGIEAFTVPARDGATDLAALAAAADERTAAVIVQVPNFLGVIEDGFDLAAAAKAKGALLVACVDPISLAVLEPPGAWGADIACGEGQSLASGLAYGGPYFGFFAGRMANVRQMPGRIAGETVDLEGRRGFVLTLGTREQHIRRERATSNICTNQGLLALRGLVYLAAMGPQGLREAAEGCIANAHYAADRIASVRGYALAHPGRAFYQEFVVRCPVPAVDVIAALRRRKILPGVALSRWFPDRPHDLLVAVTEVKRRKQIDALVSALGKVGA